MNQQVVYQDISQIHPYENNPRNNEAAVGPVAQSIKEFGFRVPILIDGRGTIIAGHTRYEAAKRLGMDKVPCILVDDLTDAQIKAYRIADNKVAEASSWNDDVLRAEMDALQALDVDLSSTGFSEVELDGLLRDVDEFYSKQEPALRDFYTRMKAYVPSAFLTTFMAIPFPREAKELLFIVQKPKGEENNG